MVLLWYITFWVSQVPGFSQAQRLATFLGLDRGLMGTFLFLPRDQQTWGQELQCHPPL